MLISDYRNKVLINYERIEGCEAGERTVFIHLTSGKELQAGRYESGEQTSYALSLLENAILNEESYFEFPHPKDIEERLRVARQHGNRVTNRKASHGGS